VNRGWIRRLTKFIERVRKLNVVVHVRLLLLAVQIEANTACDHNSDDANNTERQKSNQQPQTDADTTRIMRIGELVVAVEKHVKGGASLEIAKFDSQRAILLGDLLQIERDRIGRVAVDICHKHRARDRTKCEDRVLFGVGEGVRVADIVELEGNHERGRILWIGPLIVVDRDYQVEDGFGVIPDDLEIERIPRQAIAASIVDVDVRVITGAGLGGRPIQREKIDGSRMLVAGAAVVILENRDCREIGDGLGFLVDDSREEDRR